MSDQSLDKSKCIDGSYGWVVVLFTMLVGFVPGSNMAKAISLAPIVCMNFQINEATFGLFVAVIYTALVFQLKDPMLYYPPVSYTHLPPPSKARVRRFPSNSRSLTGLARAS